MRKVLVFGVFDGLHKGHFSFLKQAKSLGDYLIVAVARDSAVKKIKGYSPKFKLADRMRRLGKERAVDKVVAGDKKISGYEVLIMHKPDIIALGYDQTDLKNDLLRFKEKFIWKPAIKTLKAYAPRRYHSALMRK